MLTGVIFCKISKNTFFTEHLWAAASESCLWKDACLQFIDAMHPRETKKALNQRSYHGVFPPSVSTDKDNDNCQ